MGDIHAIKNETHKSPMPISLSSGNTRINNAAKHNDVIAKVKRFADIDGQKCAISAPDRK